MDDLVFVAGVVVRLVCGDVVAGVVVGGTEVVFDVTAVVLILFFFNYQSRYQSRGHRLFQSSKSIRALCRA